MGFKSSACGSRRFATFVLVDGEDGAQAAAASIDFEGRGSGTGYDIATGQTFGDSMPFLSRPTQRAGVRNDLLCIGQDPKQPTRSITLVMVAR